MPSYSKPEVVLVRYPFSDLSSSKVRPAVGLNVETAVKRGIYTIKEKLVRKRVGELEAVDAEQLEKSLRV